MNALHAQARATPPAEKIEDEILQLQPKTETQRWLKSEALKLTEEVLRDTLASAEQCQRFGAADLSDCGDLLVVDDVRELRPQRSTERHRGDRVRHLDAVGRGGGLP